MSIFDLSTEVKDLSSSNQGTSRLQYDQIPTSRDVTGNSFANGAISFKFEVSGMKWFMPSKSYIRTRVNLTKAGGAPLVVADNIAVNMDLMPNLFQSCEFRLQDKVVSRIADFVPQIDALDNRLTKSKAWIDSIGNSTNWWQADQSLRQVEVSNDGTVVNQNASAVPDVTTTANALGFVDANTWAYTDATGGLACAQNAGGLNAAAASAAFPVGSYFKFVGVADVPEVDLQVLTNNGAGALTVRRLLSGDIVATGNRAFVRVVKSPAVSVPSRRLSSFETIWQPTLSIFKVKHAMPCGRYELVLNPQTSSAWKQRVIESALGAASKVPGVDYDVSIVDMYLYVQTVEGPRCDNMTYLLDLEQIRCQSDKIDNASFGQKNADISPSTYAVTVAYQDVRAGQHTGITPSKFKFYAGAGNPTATNDELKLNRLFINYAGQNLPAPDADPSFDVNIDRTTERYLQNTLYSGGYYDAGGVETIEEWGRLRGAYYYFETPRDGTDRSTRLTVHTGFAVGTDVTNCRLLMFDHSKQICSVRVQDGRTVDVQLQDA
jgi:hypothetical protein